VLLTVGGLVVLGGLGFVVLHDLWRRFARRESRAVTTQTRIAGWTTVVLIAGATVVFLYFEGGMALAGLGAGARLTNALFMAITPRTAGFNSIDYGLASNPTVALTVALMIIGGSPGSTAGGIKTTSAALLVLGLVARLRGSRYVAVGGRTVREEAIVRAAGLAVGGIAILAFATFLLLLVEPVTVVRDRADFVRVVFEVHSAFGTVGLSMNKTGEVTAAGRLILIGLMFVGRVGPIALAAAMTSRVGRAAYRYAYDEVAVG
jgi:trk system potassium uptake protein TrkH